MHIDQHVAAPLHRLSGSRYKQDVKRGHSASFPSWTERYLQHKVSLPGKLHPGRHSDSELATLQPGDSHEERQGDFVEQFGDSD